MLAEYLRGPFLAELDELHKVRETADEVLGTLDRFNRNSQWPYELSQDEDWSPTGSHSTSAMILFAMGVAVGSIPSSILVPSLSRRNDDDMFPEVRELHYKIKEEFKGYLMQFRNNIENDRPTKNFDICWSSTYGPDDPFTLLWILELLRPYERDPDLAPWYEKVTGRSA